jgi:hypothetical protein
MTHESAPLEPRSMVMPKQRPELRHAAQWWPLSFSQEAQLIGDEWAGYTKAPRFAAHFPVAFRIRGALDLGALELALNLVIRRHRGLTAAYHATDLYGDHDRRMMLSLFARTRLFLPGLFGQWMYPDAGVRIQHSALEPVIGPLEEDQFARLAEDEGAAPLDMDVAPVMRAQALSFDSSNHLLVLTVSHMVVDGWSAGILREELMALYTAHVSGLPCSLPPVTSHSGEFAAMEHRRFRSGEFRRAAEYWQRQWNDATDSEIRHDEMPCAVRQSWLRASSTQAAKTVIGATDSRLVRRLALEHRITPYVFFRTAFTLLLHRYTGRKRIAFWANFANRRDPSSERMICSCAHSYIVPVDVSHDSTVLDLCRVVAMRLAETQRHEAVAESALPLLGTRRTKAAHTRIGFDAWPASRRRNDDSVIEPILVVGGRQGTDLSVRFRDEGEAFALYATYSTVRYSATGVHAMLEDLVQLTSSLIATVERRVSEVTCPLVIA